jgi:transcriptional regulator with XRE-family HTH domain
MPFNFTLFHKIMTQENISRERFAKLLGVSSDYVSRLETGQKTNPSLSLLEKIADYIGYPAGVLISGDEFALKARRKPAKAPSVLEFMGRSDRDRMAKQESDKRISELERFTSDLMSLNEFIMKANEIFRKCPAPAERAKRLARLARETAASGKVPLRKMPPILGVTESVLMRWLESAKVEYVCMMDERKAVKASCPDQAAMKLVCFDCEARAKGICCGFGREHDPEAFDELVLAFEDNGIYGREKHSKVLLESYEMDMSAREISEFMSRKKHGKPVPESIEDMKVRKRRK